MDINSEIQNIKFRNQKVESNKAWETSLTRKLFIALITYAAAAIWLVWIRETDAVLKALVPASAYIFSTLTLCHHLKNGGEKEINILRCLEKKYSQVH